MPTEKPTITLHWLEKSRSQRILWLIYDLEIPTKTNFVLKVYKRGSDMLAEPALKEVHPLGKSPVIEILPAGASKSFVIAESGTIVEYLAEHFGKQLIPKRYQEGKEGLLGGESETYLRYAQLMQYAEGSLMGLLVMALVIQTMKDGPQTPYLARPITRIIGGKIEGAFLNRNFKTHFDFIEDQLATSPGKGEYLCGPEITCVDYMMIYPLEAAQGRIPGVTKANYPLTAAYCERIQQKPGYKAAIQRIIEDTGSYDTSL